jgi:hypothetical protein
VAGDNATWTVASAGDATTGHQFTGLATATRYRIVQVAVASGYRTANHTDTQSIEFAIGADGKTTDVNLNNGSATNGTSGNDYLNVGEVGDTTFVLRSELEVGQAQFTKYDSTLLFDEQGSPIGKKKTLSGVSFDLYREANAGQVDLANDKLVSSAPIVSDASGVISTLAAKDANGEAVTNKLTGKSLNEGLGEGTYYFKEVATRSDFIPSTNTTDAFTVAKGSTTNYTWSDFSVNTLNTTDERLMKNTPLNAAVTLTKVDADSLLTRIIAPTKVNGATYELRKYTSEAAYEVIGTQTTSATGTRFEGTDSNGNTHSRTNTSDGQLWFVDVPAGSYKVVETVPAPGYELDATAYDVTVKQANVWAGEDYTIETTPGSGTVSDVQNSLTVTKAGIAGATTAQLAGTSFSLVPEGTAKFADGTTDAVTWTTTKDDASKTIAGKLVAGGTYKLSETAAPEGYQTSADVYIQMTAAGTLQRSADGLSGWADVADNTLTIVDVRNSLSAALVGTTEAGGNYLAGAGFSLHGTFADGSTELSWTSTDSAPADAASGLITGELVASTGDADASHVYALTQTKAPDGYAIATPTTWLRMTQSGQLQVRDGVEGNYTWTNVTDNAFKAENAQNSMTLKTIGFTDVEKEAAPLAGSTFTITGVFAGKMTEETRTLLDGTTAQGATEATMIGQLAAGSTYTISETVVPKGYIGVEDFQVRLEQDGTVSFMKNANGASAAGSTITVRNDLTVIGVSKVDDTSTTGLDGSTFTITGTFADGTTSKTLNPTKTSAATLLRQLIVNDGDADETYVYTLAETVPPDGYQVSMAPKTLRMSARGILQEKVDGEWKSAGDGLNRLIVPDEQNYLGLVATETDGTTRLSGATYTVSGTFAGEMEASTKTLRSAVASVPQMTGALVAGRDYTIAETTPAAAHVSTPMTTSYPDALLTADGAMTVRMSDNGELSYKTTAGADTWATVGQDNVLVLKNIRNAFTIEQHDQDGTRMDGATFSVVPAAGTTFADGGTAARGFSPTKASAAPIAGQLVAGGTYTVSESDIPAGYVRAAAFQVRVSADGATIALPDDGGDQSTVVGGTGIVVTVAQNSLTFVSVDGTGAPRGGSTFSLAGVFAGDVGTLTLTLLSGAGSQTLTGRLVAGNTYVLEETVAAAGYVRMTDKVTLTCNADGTLTLGEGTPSCVSLDSTGTKLMVSDPVVTEATQKTDGTSAGTSAAVVPVPQTSDASDLAGMACTGVVGLALAGLGTFLVWRRRFEC